MIDSYNYCDDLSSNDDVCIHIINYVYVLSLWPSCNCVVSSLTSYPHDLHIMSILLI